MNDTPFEIERKFLIRMPDISWLSAMAECSQISQTYLVNDIAGTSERVRCRRSKNGVVYTHTKKTRITAIRRIEIEHEISREEYEQLLLRADPARRTIEKTRYCLRRNGLLYEIDVFPFWPDRAFLEVELTHEDQPLIWPEGVTCIREVTDDGRYTNSALARSIPWDDIEEFEKEE